MTTIMRTMMVGLWRDTHTLIWNIVLPIGLLLGLGLYFGDPGYSERLLAGALAVNLLFGAMTATAFYVVTQRSRGVYKLLRATPLPTLGFVTAMSGARLAVTLVTSLALVVAGITVLDVTIHPARLALMLLMLLAGSVCFTALGFLIGNLSRDENQVSVFTNLLSLPMLLTSEAFYSLADAPGWVRTIGQLQPFHYLVDALAAATSPERAVSAGWLPLALLSGFALLSVGLAALTFRWDPEQPLLRAGIVKTGQ